MSQAEFALRQQTEAVRDLLHAIADAGHADDTELVADAVEGETGLHEAIGAALDEIDDEEALCIGLRAKEEQFASRRAACERRIERIRASIERAMITIDLPTLKLPSATLTVAKRKPGVVIDNEAEVPSRFFVQPDPPAPRIDRKALEAALSDGPVAGAHMDNGTVSLTVRRK